MDKKKSFIIFFSLLLASFVFFSFGTISSAAGQSDIANLKSGLQSHLGFSITDNAASQIIDYWSGNNYTYLWFWKRSDGYVRAYVANGYSRPSDYYPTQPCYESSNIYPSTNTTITWTSYNSYINSNSSWGWFVGSWSDFHTVDIDFDNLIYAVNIPVPELNVTYVPAISMLGGLPQTNNVFTDINVEDNAAFKIQLAVKVTVADMVQIGLTNGTTTYKYLDWTEGALSDIYSLEDLQDAENISISNSDLAAVWDTLYNSLYDDSDFPVFSSSVPFWNSNPNAQKYLEAQSYYRNNMARQMPMYGTRLEVFARYFAIDGTNVYVGAWRHWNSAEPLNTEKVTDKYQDQQPFPGTENTNTNVDYDTSDDTYTTIGNQTGVYSDPYTQVVINQNVPNYPDYPTAVSYNHDNILLQFIETANQLPNFFGQFGAFLTDTFSFIDRSVWAIIGFGFMCSIVVMIVKIL